MKVAACGHHSRAPVGFVHADRSHAQTRPGLPNRVLRSAERRGCHLGCLMAEAMCALMHSAGAVAAWLSAVPPRKALGAPELRRHRIRR